MTQLTATHLTILDGAIARDDGLAVRPGDGSREDCGEAVKQGLGRELRDKDDMPVWREDERGKR